MNFESSSRKRQFSQNDKSQSIVKKSKVDFDHKYTSFESLVPIFEKLLTFADADTIKRMRLVCKDANILVERFIRKLNVPVNERRNRPGETLKIQIEGEDCELQYSYNLEHEADKESFPVDTTITKISRVTTKRLFHSIWFMNVSNLVLNCSTVSEFESVFKLVRRNIIKISNEIYTISKEKHKAMFERTRLPQYQIIGHIILTSEYLAQKDDGTKLVDLDANSNDASTAQFIQILKELPLMINEVKDHRVKCNSPTIFYNSTHRSVLRVNIPSLDLNMINRTSFKNCHELWNRKHDDCNKLNQVFENRNDTWLLSVLPFDTEMYHFRCSSHFKFHFDELLSPSKPIIY